MKTEEMCAYLRAILRFTKTVRIVTLKFILYLSSYL